MGELTLKEQLLVKKLSVLLKISEQRVLNTSYVELLEMIVDQHDIVILDREMNH
jgi:hypothetical protein